MKHRLLKSLFSLLVLTLSAVESFAAVGISANCSLLSGPVQTIDYGPTFKYCDGADSYGASTAKATGYYGYLKIGAWGQSGVNGIYTQGASAGASGYFNDYLTIQSPGSHGRTGRATIDLSMSLSGMALTDGTGVDYGFPWSRSQIYANFSVFVEYANGDRIIDAASYLAVDNVQNNSDQTITIESFKVIGSDIRPTVLITPDGGFDFTIDQWRLVVPIEFSIGVPLRLQVSAGLNVYASGYSSKAELDATHSLYWNGIKDFQIDGAPAEFSVASESGTDWTMSFVPSPVPEVGSIWLLVIGLFGLAAYRRSTV